MRTALAVTVAALASGALAAGVAFVLCRLVGE